MSEAPGVVADDAPADGAPASTTATPATNATDSPATPATNATDSSATPATNATDSSATPATNASAAPAPATNAASMTTPAADLTALQPRVEEKTYGISRTMIDYYAITMIVMMFFMGNAISSASAFYNQRKDGTLRRILASPQRKVSIYLQMVLQSVPQNLAQVLVAMLISVTVFGAHYAVSWQLNVLLFVMLFIAGFAASSLFLVLGIFIRVNPMLVFVPVMWVFLFVSGTFSKQIFIPGFTTVMPPYLIQTAAFDLTLFGNIGPSIIVVFVSIALIVASTLLGCALIRRKDVAT
jgi:ABC-type multidrug transport system permease subunit